MSDTSGLILNICPNWRTLAPVRSSINLRSVEIVWIWERREAGSPMAEARFASGSASTASTRRPSAAYSLARVPATVDFPTPPLPEMASFMVRSSDVRAVWFSLSRHDGEIPAHLLIANHPLDRQHGKA